MLTNKQERFCVEYLIDSNATQAAIRTGYSPRSASTAGSANMQKPQIIERIAALRETITDDLCLTILGKRQLLYRRIHESGISNRDLVALLAEDSKLAGHYAPELTASVVINADARAPELAQIAEQARLAQAKIMGLPEAKVDSAVIKDETIVDNEAEG